MDHCRENEGDLRWRPPSSGTLIGWYTSMVEGAGWVPRWLRADQAVEVGCVDDKMFVATRVVNLSNFCPHCGRIALGEIVQVMQSSYFRPGLRISAGAAKRRPPFGAVALAVCSTASIKRAARAPSLGSRPVRYLMTIVSSKYSKYHVKRGQPWSAHAFGGRGTGQPIAPNGSTFGPDDQNEVDISTSTIRTSA